MPTLPISYCLKDYTVMFLEQYKQMAFYDKSQGKITHVHVLTGGRKLTMNASTSTLTLSAVPEGTLYKTTYTMDSDSHYIGFDESCLIVGIGDQRDGGGVVDSYPLNNSNCTVVIKYETTNSISVSTTCNDDCSGTATGCKNIATQSNVTVYS